MDLTALHEIAERMVAPGKGILAADESTGTIKKRFDSIGLESTETTRRDYREMLFRAADANATPLVDLIERSGAVPGIKVDKGTVPLPGFPGETITEGMDGLGARLDRDRE